MPRPLRSLRNRLALIFALIVAGAIGIVYFYVAPQLEDAAASAQKLERSATTRGASPPAARGGRHRRRRTSCSTAACAPPRRAPAPR